jgi:hypothetical protein
MRNRSSSNRCERDLPDLHSAFRPGDFPTLFPTPLTEYVDRGDSIVNEVIRKNEGSRTIFLRVIRKDSEEYRKVLEQGHD